MKRLKVILYAIGFLIGYALFVEMNVQYISGWGCWRDLEWLGKQDMQIQPSISMGLFAALQDPLWALTNLVLIFTGWQFEKGVLRWWYSRKN